VLDALVMQCLAKDPNDRPASASEVSARLVGAVRADAWTGDAARAWWERHQPLMRLDTGDAAVAEPLSVDVVRLRRRPA
jgi:hypothetical protein